MKFIALLAVAFAILVPSSAPSAEPKGKAKKPAASKSEPKKSEKPEAKQEVSAEAEKVAKELTEAQSAKLLDLINKGDDAALMSLPGVGAARAEAIKKARPVKNVAAATLVEGIGVGALKAWVKHAKAGFPAGDAPKKTKTEGSSKKEGASKAKKKSSN